MLFDTREPVVGDIARVYLLQRVLNLSNTETKVLDVGCGTGDLWQPVLGKCNFKLWGIDIDSRSIKVAQQRIGSKARLEVANIYDLSRVFPTAFFDIVVSTQVFYRLKRLSNGFEEINQVLKPGGRLLFTIGCTKYYRDNKFLGKWRECLREKLKVLISERAYYRKYDEVELSTLLQQAGFEVQDSRFHTVHPLKEIHNKIISAQNKNRMLKRWWELEEELRQDDNFKLYGKPYCLSLYIEAVKR